MGISKCNNNILSCTFAYSLTEALQWAFLNHVSSYQTRISSSQIKSKRFQLSKTGYVTCKMRNKMQLFMSCE